MEATTVAGSGTAGHQDGNAMTATFSVARGLATNRAGDVFIMDYGFLRKLAGGVVTTIAGSKFGTGFGDGLGQEARFHRGSGGLAMAPGGLLFVADRCNHRIRKINPAGAVTTFAGSGTAGAADGQGEAASFNNPSSVAVDRDGYLYVADSSNYVVRKISPTGAVTTFAGRTEGFQPAGIAVDSKGNVVAADYQHHRIVKIAPSGTVLTLAGSGRGFADGQGAHAQFNGPCGLALDGEDNIFVVDTGNFRIRKVTPGGAVTAVAGSGDGTFADGHGANAGFSYPFHIAIDIDGNLLVSDGPRIRSIAAGVVPPTPLRAIPTSTRVANFSSLLDDPTFADVEFQVQGKTTTAHRNILSARCEYFRAMFTGNFTEGQPGSSGKVVCRVEDTTTPAFKFVLRYLYTDVLDDPEDDDAVQVMRLADRYGVERLVAHCSDIIRITHTNAVPWLIQADQHSMETLRQNTKQHLVHNFGQIRKAKRQKFALLCEHPKLLVEVVQEIEAGSFSAQ